MQTPTKFDFLTEVFCAIDGHDLENAQVTMLTNHTFQIKTTDRQKDRQAGRKRQRDKELG